MLLLLLWVVFTHSEKCMHKWNQELNQYPKLTLGCLHKYIYIKVLFSLLSPYSKMFDIELCPLPFSMEEMFGFISCRFSGYPASVQEQALLWLHVSTDTHAQSHTHSPVSCFHLHILWFCPQCVWIEQVVMECDSLGMGPAEYGSGSQNETERDRRDFYFHPICTHSLLPCIHGSISSFLSQLWSKDCINLARVNRSHSNQTEKWCPVWLGTSLSAWCTSVISWR